MSKRPKLIATDLDGTIVHHDGTITQHEQANRATIPAVAPVRHTRLQMRYLFGTQPPLDLAAVGRL